jgi:hypothetical protein
VFNIAVIVPLRALWAVHVNVALTAPPGDEPMPVPVVVQAAAISIISDSGAGAALMQLFIMCPSLRRITESGLLIRQSGWNLDGHQFRAFDQWQLLAGLAAMRRGRAKASLGIPL